MHKVPFLITWLIYSLCWLLWLGLRVIPYRAIIAYLWDKSGARALYELYRPPTEQEKSGKRPPSTITLWIGGVVSALFGIYTVIFGIASNRYESEVDRLEMRAASVIALLANDSIRPEACSQIGEVQNRKVPYKPELFSYQSIIKSFDSEYDQTYEESTLMLKRAVESSKKHLEKAYFNKTDLSGYDLSDGNLRNSKIVSSSLDLVNINGTTLKNAEITDSSFVKTIMEGADFEYAKFASINFNFSKIVFVNFNFAEFNTFSFLPSWFNLKKSPLRTMDKSLVHRVAENRSRLNHVSVMGSNFNFSKIGNIEIIGAIIVDSNFQGADISHSDLRGAILDTSIFQDAYLRFADLSFTELRYSNFDCASLVGANLEGISYWEHNSFSGCNIFGIQNAPEGFKDWALWNGAVEMNVHEWEKFTTGH